MLRVLHCGDLHIDFKATRLGSQKIVDGVNQYHVERLKRVRGILQKGLELDVDCIVIEGDIHNKPNPPAQEYADLYAILDEVPEKIPIYIINGNHDEVSSRGSPLLPLAGRRNNIHVMLYPQVREIQGVLFFFSPWGTTFEEMQQFHQYKNKPKILVGHTGVTGVNGMNWGELGDEKGTVHIDQLVSLDCNGIMLGHHHNQTELAPNIWYAGSPECFNFGERDHNKGFLVWDIQENGDVTVQKFKTEFPKFLVITHKELLNLSLPNDFKNIYLRIDGEVTAEERSNIIKKVRELKGCLGVKYNLKMLTRRDVSAHIPGKTSKQILTNFLNKTKTYTEQQIETFLKIDDRIEREVME